MCHICKCALENLKYWKGWSLLLLCLQGAIAGTNVIFFSAETPAVVLAIPHLFYFNLINETPCPWCSYGGLRVKVTRIKATRQKALMSPERAWSTECVYHIWTLYHEYIQTWHARLKFVDRQIARVKQHVSLCFSLYLGIIDLAEYDISETSNLINKYPPRSYMYNILSNELQKKENAWKSNFYGQTHRLTDRHTVPY